MNNTDKCSNCHNFKTIKCIDIYNINSRYTKRVRVFCKKHRTEYFNRMWNAIENLRNNGIYDPDYFLVMKI